MKKAIIIGSSSGIGLELAKLLSQKGYMLGLTARRVELLSAVKKELLCQTHIQYMDIANTSDAPTVLMHLISEMGGVDLIIVSAGIGHINRDLDWNLEEETIKTNVLGVTAVITTAVKYFMEKGEGHLAAISSVAAIRGGADSPAYYASKAFLSNYLEGIRCKLLKEKKTITITDIRPGLVDTAMAKGEGLFWVMPLDKVAKQIYDALRKKRRTVYITKRWGIIALLLRIMPDSIYSKL